MYFVKKTHNFQSDKGATVTHASVNMYPNHTSCAQVHKLPWGHCEVLNYWEVTLLVLLTTYISCYICICICIKRTLNKYRCRFYRRVKVKAKKNIDQLKLKSNSNWTPGKLPNCVDSFIPPVVMKDKSRRKELKHLQQRADIIITKGNKGSAVVIIDVENSIKKVSRHLSNTNNYQKLNIDTNTVKNGKLAPTWQGKNTDLSFTPKNT